MTDENYEKYLQGTVTALKLSEQEKQPYDIEVLGKALTVYPGVFSPKYFADSAIFAEQFPIQAGETVLEIGPGTGILSVFALYKGASHVVAVDINPLAVNNTLHNISRHGFAHKAMVMQGNLYEPLRQDQRFDTIMWNAPFGFIPQRKLSILQRATLDPEYRSMQVFISQAKNHLTMNGRLLIGFSSTLGRLDLLSQYCREASMSLNLLYTEKSVEVYPVEFEVFEAKPCSPFPPSRRAIEK